MRPSYGCVILTEGGRPDELRDALDSLRRQRGVDVEIVVVGNGWGPRGLPEGVRSVALPENVGVPAGRNAGVPHVSGELLLFLDDDASFPDDDALERLARFFAEDPKLAGVQPRLVDPTGRPARREWVPRLVIGDRTRSSDIVVLFEAAVVIRRDVFEQLGGWAGFFFFYHEGADLTWRMWDAGYRAWYAGDVVAYHHARPAKRRGHFFYLSGRNRVWLARRNLPVPVAATHVALWFLRNLASVRSRPEAAAVLRGYCDGLRTRPPDRRPLRWRTIWRMTLAGRPPVV
jgi:GT2 family glycosyltransferase